MPPYRRAPVGQRPTKSTVSRTGTPFASWRRVLASAGVTPHSEYQYGRMLSRFADFRVQHPETSLTACVRAFLKTLTPAVGHTAYLALKAAIPDAVEWQTVPHPRPRRNEAVLEATLLAPEDRETLRGAIRPEPKLAAMFELFWVLRRVEVTRARWADINLTTGQIAVPHGKGGIPRWTLLPETAQRALAAWYRAAGEPPDSTLIFPGRFGGPMNPGSVSHIVRRTLKAAGLTRRWRGAHAFRRTLATEYLAQNPDDLRGLQKLLGHASIVTTKLYDYTRPADLRPRLDRYPTL